MKNLPLLFLPLLLGLVNCTSQKSSSAGSDTYVTPPAPESKSYYYVNGHRQPPTLQDSLLAGNWELTEIEGRPVNTPDYRLRQPTMELIPWEQRVMGNTGCNLYRGTISISIDESRISFSQLLSDARPCSTRTLELAYLNVLNGRTLNYHRQADRLTLLNGDRVVLVFRKMKK